MSDANDRKENEKARRERKRERRGRERERERTSDGVDAGRMKSGREKKRREISPSLLKLFAGQSCLSNKFFTLHGSRTGRDRCDVPAWPVLCCSFRFHLGASLFSLPCSPSNIPSNRTRDSNQYSQRNSLLVHIVFYQFVSGQEHLGCCCPPPTETTVHTHNSNAHMEIKKKKKDPGFQNVARSEIYDSASMA